MKTWWMEETWLVVMTDLVLGLSNSPVWWKAEAV